jgi:tripartite-type tricarboxylate transporter receptor subunit TctC
MIIPRLVLSAALLIAAIATAQAHSYPIRAIKLVVPFPAGGPTDTAARLVGQALQARIGQTVVIENQGGAGGTIGARQVASAPADGYTLMMIAIANTYGTQPVLYKLDYDPMKAFTPVATVVTDKQVMVANPAMPFDTPQDIVRYAKANPGKLTYGAAYSIGPHFIMELFKIKTGADILHVPYRGSGPIHADLIGGQIQLSMSGKSVLLPHILAGRMKAIAVTAAERWPELPNVATLVEGGHMDFPYETSFGVIAPAGTPAAVIERLNSAINEGLQTPESRAAIAKLGIEPKITSLKEFAAMIAEAGPRWAEIVRVTGIKAAQ